MTEEVAIVVCNEALNNGALDHQDSLCEAIETLLTSIKDYHQWRRETRESLEEMKETVEDALEAMGDDGER